MRWPVFVSLLNIAVTATDWRLLEPSARATLIMIKLLAAQPCSLLCSAAPRLAQSGTMKLQPVCSSAHERPLESLQERLLRGRVGTPFPSTLLLEGSRLPSLVHSRHFVNLTNGLDLVPLLEELQLPFSVVRIRSTSLEQQAFESLLLELDANLLLALALGHSCIVWDTGCRNRRSGAPRALWYGLEFIRFALNRAWCSSSSGSSGSQGGSSSSCSSNSSSSTQGSSQGSDSSSGRGRLLRAHIRGHDVSRDFEAVCRSLQPSTKTRLRYYKRYTSLQVQQQGVQLAGAFRQTDRDEDVQHFVGFARQYCGPDRALAAGAASDPINTTQLQEDNSYQQDMQKWHELAGAGIGVLTATLSHSQYDSLSLHTLQ